MTLYRYGAQALRGWRKRGYPGLKPAMNMVYKYRKPIAGAAAVAAGSYAVSKFKRKSVKKKGLHQKTFQSGQGGSFSKFFYGKRKLPRGYSKVYKALSKNYYAVNNAARKTVGVGVQQGFDDLHLFDRTDCIAISGLVNAGSNTNRFLLVSCSAELVFTNAELSNCRFTIYDIVARRDLSTTTTQSPGTAWANAYADEGGANADWKDVGSTPFSADLFTQFYKVVKITHGCLAQGQTHSHRVSYHPKRVVDDEYLLNAQYGYKGLTCFCMVVFHGEPANDATTKSQVSTGAIALDMIYRKQYKYTYITDDNTSWSITNNLPSAFTVNESIVDIGSGTVVTDAAA